MRKVSPGLGIEPAQVQAPLTARDTVAVRGGIQRDDLAPERWHSGLTEFGFGKHASGHAAVRL